MDLNTVREGNLSFFVQAQHGTPFMYSHKGKTGDVNTLDNEVMEKKIAL